MAWLSNMNRMTRGQDKTCDRGGRSDGFAIANPSDATNCATCDSKRLGRPGGNGKMDSGGEWPPMWVALPRVTNRHRGRGQPHPGALPTGPQSRTRTRHKAPHDNQHGRGVESANTMPRQIHNCTVCVSYVYIPNTPYLYRTYTV